jgi:hypothetical protein
MATASLTPFLPTPTSGSPSWFALSGQPRNKLKHSLEDRAPNCVWMSGEAETVYARSVPACLKGIRRPPLAVDGMEKPPPSIQARGPRSTGLLGEKDLVNVLLLNQR